MSAEQEMTLAQWVESLPEIHLVRKEYAALLARAEDAEEEAKTLRRHHDRIFAAYEKKQIELSTLRESMRWIPVSERLPEDCCDVLVRRENDGAAWTDIASLDNGWFDDIAHWMPIPQPPEQETGK